jgi:hypothetical protein
MVVTGDAEGFEVLSSSCSAGEREGGREGGGRGGGREGDGDLMTMTQQLRHK